MGIRDDVDVWDGTAALQRTRRTARRRTATRIAVGLGVVAAVALLLAVGLRGGDAPWDPVPFTPTSVPAGQASERPLSTVAGPFAPPGADVPAAASTIVEAPGQPAGEAPPGTGPEEPTAPGTAEAPATTPSASDPDPGPAPEPTSPTPDPGQLPSGRPSGIEGGITTTS